MLINNYKKLCFVMVKYFLLLWFYIWYKGIVFDNIFDVIISIVRNDYVIKIFFLLIWWYYKCLNKYVFLFFYLKYILLKFIFCKLFKCYVCRDYMYIWINFFYFRVFLEVMFYLIKIFFLYD